MNSNIFFTKFDIYSKKIGFYYKNKEKIGSYFGFFLTLLYIFISIILFIWEIIRVFQRAELKVYDTTIYSQKMPTIDVNLNKLYFAFALEHPKTTSRFIDESIYTAQVAFIDKRKIGDELKTYETRYLDFEPCILENFGQDYRNLFVENELKNSYCIKDFNYNLTFAGGYKYERITYIRIRIYPCVNSTKNNNGCKSQEEIDFYLTSGYFSIVLKDFGLNPSNYSNPIVPTLQDLYTTIDKSLYKNYILNFGITEIHTDAGLINEQNKIAKYLKFKKELENFTYRDEKDYHAGKSLILVQLRLEDTIQIQTRKYTKISEIFSRIGGYMQLMNTAFLLASSIFNKIDSEIKIINSIFDFNLKENKMILRLASFKEFKKEFNSKNSKKINFSTRNHLSDIKQIDNYDNKSKNNLIFKDKDNINISSLNISDFKKSTAGQNCIINTDKNKNIVSFENCKKHSNNLIILKRGYGLRTENLDKNNNDVNTTYNREYNDHINLNIFSYFFCIKNPNIYKNIELYHLGNSYYRKRMDIVQVFSLLSIVEDFIKR